MKTRKYNPEIDLAKFLFSVVIVLYHSTKLTSCAGEGIMPFGFLATDFFFMVSGYLMVKSSKKYEERPLGKSTFDFLMSKVKSLYPYLVFSFVIAFVARQIIFFSEGSRPIVKLFKDTVASLHEVILLQGSGIDFGKIYNGPTWYISSMLIAMAILFPILMKKKEWFVNIGSLAAAVLVYAFISQEKGTLNSLGWSGFVSFGVLRAIAGLSLGVFLTSLTDKIAASPLKLNKFGKIALALLEGVLGLTLLLLMQNEGKNEFDFVAILLIFFICLIIFSSESALSEILPEKLCRLLGRLSLVIYFNHRIMVFLLNAFAPELSYKRSLVIYIAASALLVALAEVIVPKTKNLAGKILMRLFIRKD